MNWMLDSFWRMITVLMAIFVIKEFGNIHASYLLYIILVLAITGMMWAVLPIAEDWQKTIEENAKITRYNNRKRTKTVTKGNSKRKN